MRFYKGAAMAMAGVCLLGAAAWAQEPPPGAPPPGAPPAGGPPPGMRGDPAPTDKAAIYSYKDNARIWADLEARQVISKRIAEGGTFSINVRIVKPNDTPLVHGGSLDIWVVQDGTAVAVTGGTMANPQRRGQSDDYSAKEIVGGREQLVSRGDIVFVPKGVPHMFKDMKGFHAYLIRFDTP